MLGRIVFNDRVSLDLDEPIGVDKASHLDHCAGGAYVMKEFPMYLGYLVPVIDSGKVNPGTNDVGQ